MQVTVGWDSEEKVLQYRMFSDGYREAAPQDLLWLM